MCVDRVRTELVQKIPSNPQCVINRSKNLVFKFSFKSIHIDLNLLNDPTKYKFPAQSLARKRAKDDESASIRGPHFFFQSEQWNWTGDRDTV